VIRACMSSFAACGITLLRYNVLAVHKPSSPGVCRCFRAVLTGLISFGLSEEHLWRETLHLRYP
jgi:hypothetical protein